MSERNHWASFTGGSIYAREVVAIDEAGAGLCWVGLTRFGDEWPLIRSNARDVSRAVRKLPPDTGGQAVGSVPGSRAVSLLSYLALGGLAVAVIFGTVHRCAGRRSPPASFAPPIAHEPSSAFTLVKRSESVQRWSVALPAFALPDWHCDRARRSTIHL